jgi:hypothetical protein
MTYPQSNNSLDAWVAPDAPIHVETKSERLVPTESSFRAQLAQNFWGGVGAGVFFFCVAMLCRVWEVEQYGLSAIPMTRVIATSFSIGGVTFGAASALRFLSDDVIEWFKSVYWRAYKLHLLQRIAELEMLLEDERAARATAETEARRYRAINANFDYVHEEEDPQNVAVAQAARVEPVRVMAGDEREEYARVILNEWNNNRTRPEAYSRDNMRPLLTNKEWGLGMALLEDAGVVKRDRPGGKRLIELTSHAAARRARRTRAARGTYDDQIFRSHTVGSCCIFVGRRATRGVRCCAASACLWRGACVSRNVRAPHALERHRDAQCRRCHDGRSLLDLPRRRRAQDVLRGRRALRSDGV